MRQRNWYRYYLLVAGSVLFTLGTIIAVRTYFLRQAYPGFILGGALMIYGLMRVRQTRARVSK